MKGENPKVFPAVFMRIFGDDDPSLGGYSLKKNAGRRFFLFRYIFPDDF